MPPLYSPETWWWPELRSQQRPSRRARSPCNSQVTGLLIIHKYIRIDPLHTVCIIHFQSPPIVFQKIHICYQTNCLPSIFQYCSVLSRDYTGQYKNGYIQLFRSVWFLCESVSSLKSQYVSRSSKELTADPRPIRIQSPKQDQNFLLL
jgi:hypothetical protein